MAPPWARKGIEYSCPTVPAGNGDRVSISRGLSGLTKMENVPIVDCGRIDELSLTVTLNEYPPACVGVPLISPELLSCKPGGRLPLIGVAAGFVPPCPRRVAIGTKEVDMIPKLHVYGGVPPVVCSCCEYGIPTMAVASEVGGITSCWTI